MEDLKDTYAQSSIINRILDIRRFHGIFQDFGYGDSHSDAPYQDYNDCHGDYYDAEAEN